MPGDNCLIYGCPISRRSKYKGTGIYKVLSGDDDFAKAWREKLLPIITRNRVIDTALKERIIKKKLYICQRHYRPDQIPVNDSRTSVKPGEIPELNIPTKSFPSTPFQPRVSSATSTTKRKCLELSSQSSPTSTPLFTNLLMNLKIAYVY